jgi:hypothetical protein
VKCYRHHQLLILSAAVLAAAAFPGCMRTSRDEPELYVGPAVVMEVTATGEGAQIVNELGKYARLFGCPVVKAKEGADYGLTGTVSLAEVKEADGTTEADQSAPEEHVWRVDAELAVRETGSGKTVEEFPPLEDYRYRAADRDAARREAVRAVTSQLARLVFYFGETLGQPDVRELLADLVIDTKDEYFYNDVVANLEEIGLRAVPYLIWQMENDRRLVALSGDLPGLKDEEADKVRVYHVANYALEQILNRKTRLWVDAAPNEVTRHVRAWQGLWQKRCAAYIKDPEKLDRLLAERRAAAKQPPEAAQAPVTAPAGESE